MVEIISFDSMPEMLAYMEKQGRIIKLLDGMVAPWQNDLKPGDYCWHIYDNSLGIYVEIIESEYEEDRQMMAQPEQKFNRLINGYSVACEEGEIGTFHVSQAMMVLTKEEFDHNKWAGWPAFPMVRIF